MPPPTETPSPEDELLLILLHNLRNAAATFGENSPPYKSIRATLEGHLKEMRQKGVATNLTQTRDIMRDLGIQQSEQKSFGNLAFRPKPQGAK